MQGSLEAIIGALDKMATDEVAARVLHAGKSTAFCDSEARDEHGALLAKAIGTFKLIPAKRN